MRKRLGVMKGVWKLFILLVLILITFSYAMFQGGFVSWFLFYSFLPFALYAICLTFYPLDRFTIQRNLVKRGYRANESLTIKVTLRRNSSFPLLFVIAEDCLSKSLTPSVTLKKCKALLFPGFRKEFSFQYTIEKLPRGEHDLNAFRIMTGDLLGFIEKGKTIQTNDQILVFPAYQQLIYRPSQNQFEQGMASSKERIQRDTSMAIGIREYQPGDRFSWINWKASAKRNEIMTKEFEQRQSHDVFIIMDCTPDIHFETIVSFTASIVYSILKAGTAIGFFSASGERVMVPIQDGEALKHRLFSHLAKVKDNSLLSLDAVLDKEEYFRKQKASFLLVTAGLTHILIEKASAFTARKCPVTILIIKDEGERVTLFERSVKEDARVRGIQVVFVHKDQFITGLLGVI